MFAQTERPNDTRRRDESTDAKSEGASVSRGSDGRALHTAIGPRRAILTDPAALSIFRAANNGTLDPSSLPSYLRPMPFSRPAQPQERAPARETAPALEVAPSVTVSVTSSASYDVGSTPRDSAAQVENGSGVPDAAPGEAVAAPWAASSPSQKTSPAAGVPGAVDPDTNPAQHPTLPPSRVPLTASVALLQPNTSATGVAMVLPQAPPEAPNHPNAMAAPPVVTPSAAAPVLQPLVAAHNAATAPVVVLAPAPFQYLQVPAPDLAAAAAAASAQVIMLAPAPCSAAAATAGTPVAAPPSAAAGSAETHKVMVAVPFALPPPAVLPDPAIAAAPGVPPPGPLPCLEPHFLSAFGVAPSFPISQAVQQFSAQDLQQLSQELAKQLPLPPPLGTVPGPNGPVPPSLPTAVLPHAPTAPPAGPAVVAQTPNLQPTGPWPQPAQGGEEGQARLAATHGGLPGAAAGTDGAAAAAAAALGACLQAIPAYRDQAHRELRVRAVVALAMSRAWDECLKHMRTDLEDQDHGAQGRCQQQQQTAAGAPTRQQLMQCSWTVEQLDELYKQFFPPYPPGRMSYISSAVMYEALGKGIACRGLRPRPDGRGGDVALAPCGTWGAERTAEMERMRGELAPLEEAARRSHVEALIAQEGAEKERAARRRRLRLDLQAAAAFRVPPDEAFQRGAAEGGENKEEAAPGCMRGLQSDAAAAAAGHDTADKPAQAAPGRLAFTPLELMTRIRTYLRMEMRPLLTCKGAEPLPLHAALKGLRERAAVSLDLDVAAQLGFGSAEEVLAAFSDVVRLVRREDSSGLVLLPSEAYLRETEDNHGLHWRVACEPQPSPLPRASPRQGQGQGQRRQQAARHGAFPPKPRGADVHPGDPVRQDPQQQGPQQSQAAPASSAAGTAHPPGAAATARHGEPQPASSLGGDSAGSWPLPSIFPGVNGLPGTDAAGMSMPLPLPHAPPPPGDVGQGQRRLSDAVAQSCTATHQPCPAAAAAAAAPPLHPSGGGDPEHSSSGYLSGSSCVASSGNNDDGVGGGMGGGGGGCSHARPTAAAGRRRRQRHVTAAVAGG